jgi:hypothetical protein
MRVLSAKSGLLGTSPTGLVRFSAKGPSRAGLLSSLGMTTQEKTQNRGNEAKKWVKTKDITFLSAAK